MNTNFAKFTKSVSNLMAVALCDKTNKWKSLILYFHIFKKRSPYVGNSFSITKIEIFLVSVIALEKSIEWQIKTFKIPKSKCQFEQFWQFWIPSTNEDSSQKFLFSICLFNSCSNNNLLYFFLEIQIKPYFSRIFESSKHNSLCSSLWWKWCFQKK